MFDHIENPTEVDKNKSSRNLKKLSIYVAAVIAVVVGLFSYGVISSDDSLGGLKKFLKPFSLFSFASDKQLKGEDRDRINVLLLGIGGEGHDGAFLTDTIMLASYKPSTKQVALLSVPRDLIVNLKDYGWRKINAANAFGEVTNPGKGPEKTAAVMTQITNQPIDYYVRVDFSGFKKLIDQFGGVDVNVENTLDDYYYPIDGKEDVYPVSDRYEHLHIEKGLQHMDGETALKYSRSRHASGVEGSDFARSRRQQQIMTAFKDKLLNYKNLLQPNKVKALLAAYQENVDTNMDFWEMAKLGLMLKDFDKSKIVNKVLDDAPNGPLVAQNFNGVFILEPKNKDYSDIKQIAENIFDSSYVYKPGTNLTGLPESELINSSSTLGVKKTPSDADTPDSSTMPTDQSDVPTNSTSSPTVRQAPMTEIPQDLPPATTNKTASVDVLNGTFVAGLAKTQSTKLTNLGLQVLATGNALNRQHSKTLIYGANLDNFADIAQKLADMYSVDQLLPYSQMKESSAEMATKADFVVVLGTDVKQ